MPASVRKKYINIRRDKNISPEDIKEHILQIIYVVLYLVKRGNCI